MGPTCNAALAQIIEKRIIKKLVPKMVEVEEEYEYEVGLTGVCQIPEPWPGRAAPKS